MNYQYHVVTSSDSITTIAFNSPPLNINNEDVVCERCNLLDNILADPSIRVIILTSAISGHFGAGSDLNEYLVKSKDHYTERTERVLKIVQKFIESDKISIAAINGNAIGSDADLTLMCDIRIMGESYYLRWPEAYLGLMPNWGASTLLPVLVGRSHALEWLLTGRPIYTQELQATGLLHGIYSPENVLEEAQLRAEHLCKADQNSVQAIKATILHSFYMPLRYAFSADVQISAN